MRKTRRVRGFTLVELLVVVLIIAMLIAILLPSLAKARKAARRMQCSSNMRQVGLGIFQYEKQFRCMPNAQCNAFRQFAQMMTVSADIVDTADAKSTAIYRCPSDKFGQSLAGQVWNSLSYAPLVDSGYWDSDDDDTADSNATYCAWSYFRKGYGEPTVWTMRSLADVAPNTALLTEFWDPTNRLNLGTETPPGYTLHDWSGTDDNTMGTIEWAGNRCEEVLDGVSSTGVDDCGGYTFLQVFGFEADQRTIDPSKNMLLHEGVVNVLYSDGSVIQEYLKDVTGEPPKDIAQWTAASD